MNKKDLLIKFAKENNIEITSTRSINYGVQLSLKKDNEEVLVNIYSGKKGEKIIIQGGESLVLTAMLNAFKDGRPFEMPLHSGKMPGIDVIGSDESGKGDYFGPLVVSAVYLDEKGFDALSSSGIRDSKALSDSENSRLAIEIKKHLAFKTEILLPEKYNRLYAETGNLNAILTRIHGTLASDLHKTTKARFYILDQFGKGDIMKSFVEKNIPGLSLFQVHRGESNFSVAAASVLARAEFLGQMEILSSMAGEELLKGAGDGVLLQAKRLYKKLGREYFFRLAKQHFSLTEKIEG